MAQSSPLYIHKFAWFQMTVWNHTIPYGAEHSWILQIQYGAVIFFVVGREVQQVSTEKNTDI
jgi:hypothetical protein